MGFKKGIGYSALSDKVYLGKQNKEKGMWVGEKEDVTNDWLNIAFEYFEENSIRNIGSPNSDKENLFINILNDRESLERVGKKLLEMAKEFDI